MTTTSAQQLVRALDPRYYTDARIFAIEQQHLLNRTWQFAGHVSQLAQPGDYFCVEIAGQSLFLVRNKEHQINAFYNVCQHRAHQLLSGAGHTRQIVCPYHAWTYALNGTLRAAPNAHRVPGFQAAKICLNPVAVENFHGFLFVNLDVNTKPMDEWFPQVRKQLHEFVPHINRLKPMQWHPVDEACNWKVSIENYSECYHCARNHKTFASGVVKSETYNIRPQGYCLRHTTECQNLDSMSYPINLEANDKAGSYSSWFLWPMFSFQVYPGNVLNTYHWRAVDTEHVVVWRGWYTIDGEDSPIVSKLAHQDLITTVAEDISLVESVQRGMHSTGYTPGPLIVDPDEGVMSEHSVMHLQRWMREAIDPHL